MSMNKCTHVFRCGFFPENPIIWTRKTNYQWHKRVEKGERKSERKNT